MLSKSLCLNCLAALLLYKVSGCHPKNSYWIKGPVTAKREINKATWNYYTKFTIIPYSELMGGNSSRQENAVMFSLANVFFQKGCQYVSTVDSADFVITAVVTNDYKDGENLDSDLVHIPEWKNIKPFSMDPTNFGTDAIQPEAWMAGPLSQSQPKFRAYVFNSATKQCICAYVAGAIVKDNNFLHASQHLYWPFRDSLIHAQHPLRVGKGEAGFQFAIWAENGVDFWPEIVWFDTNYPMAKAGLQHGDAIMELNEVDLKNLTYDEVMSVFQGDSGKVLDMAIWRYPNHTFPVTVVMDKRDKQIVKKR